MLELRNIVKDYVSSNNVTHALKGISVNFRKNEFVSILGPSGCGKTTTLNIIGGLDRYTDGDLLINGVSTKEYKDRDWDTYRNHSIGFVFQTYNLISHQNILKNVELALTISGVSKEERRERAAEALRIVGLQGMEKKKPNQLSGGQCQRVAIARALVNNPEILLADEPTGALDTETSVQIMELLKEVAQNRLVIMVTHNPDLANAYSTRIIRMVDGVLTSDSNPFDGVEKIEKTPKIPENSQEKQGISENKEPEVNKGKKKKTSMSLLTAIGLSTSNLLSKMKRTVLVTIAGSIGIIGVSAVLGVSRGVKEYIADLQNDMLSSYPISVAEESVDYTSLITGFTNQNNKEKIEFDPKTKIGVDSMISYLMSAYSDMTNVKTNTIDDKLLKYIEQLDKKDYGALMYRYGIDPTNNIFGKWKDESNNESYYSFNGLTQRYISELETVDGFKEYATFVDLFTSFMGELPDNRDYILDQYDVIAGDGYSTNEDDLVLVVDQDTTLTDVMLGQIGVFDHNSFLNIAKCAIAEQKFKKSEGYDKLTEEEKAAAIQKIRDEEGHKYDRSFKYKDIIDRNFYYFPQESIYSLDDHVADDKTTVNLRIVVMGMPPKALIVSSQSYSGIHALVGSEIDMSMNMSSIGFMKEPSKNSEINSVNDVKGVWYGFDDIKATMSSDPVHNWETVAPTAKYIVKIDEEDITNGRVQLTTDVAAYLADPEGFSSFTTSTCSYTEDTTKIQGYSYNAVANPTWIADPSLPEAKGMKMKISSVLRLKDTNRFGSLKRGIYYSKAFANKYISDSNNENAKVTKDMKTHIKENHSDLYNRAFVKFQYYNHDPEVDGLRDDYASTLNGDLSSSFSDLFSGFMGGIDYSETNAVHLRSLCGYKVIDTKDDKGLITNTDFDLLPKEIEIYPKTFADKDVITAHLDRWNSDEVLKIDGKRYTRAQRDELTYTDTISLIAAVINTFIDAITIALVVFTSLSLVVSCFMIAVITYISVVERIKEIGVIRSLGGRKSDVANLFIMETMMTGLFSGVFGITITYILQIIVNIVLKSLFGIVIMHLTWLTALIMVLISVGLSVLSGLIPSQSAAHKDPVVALRSNE